MLNNKWINQVHYISQGLSHENHIEGIVSVLDNGAKWVQLRIKDKAKEEVLEIAIRVKEICNRYAAQLIINDHPEVALYVDAAGVHLGLEDMPVEQARSILGNEKIIGGTANTFADVQKRVLEGVDYIGLGPFRFTVTKKKLSPILGLEGYKTILAQVQHYGINTPLIAIGGITLADIPSIKSLGFHGVALSGALSENAGTLPEIYKMLNIKEEPIC